MTINSWELLNFLLIYLIGSDANGVILIGKFLNWSRRCTNKLVVVGSQSSVAEVNHWRQLDGAV